MLIDFHTHAFPEKIAHKTIDVLLAKIQGVQGKITGGDMVEKAWSDGTVDGLVREMDRSGVDMGVVLPIATKPTQAGHINEFAERITGGRIISFGSLHPYQDDWEEVLETLAEKGFRGIKLHPEFQGINADDPAMIRILKKAERLGLAVVLHAGIDVGFEGPVRCTPEMIYNILQEIEGSKLIAAHMGGYRMWDDFEKYLAGTPVMIDTAFVVDRLGAEQYKRIIRSHGADKVLFGSDMPWERPSDTLDYLGKLGLDDEEMELITHKNAEKILALCM